MEPDILTSNQRALLETVGATPLANQFYLTGGTALAGFYLRHRYSEDLDFFSEQEIDLLALNVTAKQIKKNLSINKIDFQQSFNRDMLFWHMASNSVVKTEFTYFPFPRIETGISKHGIVIDSLIDIAVNKLFTIYQRSAARDYIDLYSICRENKWEIDDLIKNPAASRAVLRRENKKTEKKKTPHTSMCKRPGWLSRKSLSPAPCSGVLEHSKPRRDLKAFP